jgi:hypothetical protein
MICDGFRMVLQMEENKGVELTGHVAFVVDEDEVNCGYEDSSAT